MRKNFADIMIRKMIQIVMAMLILLFLSEKRVQGQEPPSSLQYISNMHTLNPAFVGIWDQASLNFSTRTNWVGIKGAPLNQQLSYFTPIKNQRSSIGINLQRMNIGKEKQMMVSGDYSYQMRLDINNYFRFGIRAGIMNFDNNLMNYQAYPDHIPDPVYTPDVRMYNMTILGLGAMIYSADYYVSLSVPQIINNTFKIDRTIYSSTQEFKTIYLTGGYVFKLLRSMRVRPNLLVFGAPGKQIYYDAATIVYFPNNLQLGVNLRSDGVGCVSGQFTFNNNLRIGYAAEYTVFSDIRKYQLGTYEITLGFDFNLYRKNGRTHYF